MENKIPDNWVECRFGDVAKIHNGYAFATRDFRRDKGVPLIKQSQLNGDKVDLTKCVYLDESFLETKKDFVLKKGDVLIGMSGSVGKMCLYDLDFPALQNQRTGKAVPYSESLLNKKLFWYFLSTIERILLEKGKGLGVANVSADDIEDLVFNLPPLAEQHRIVAKLDAIIQKIESNKQRLEKIPKLLKRFRQSVLAAAVNNDGVEEISRNVCEEIQIGPFGTQLHRHEYISNGIPLVNPTHIQNGEIIPDMDLTITKLKFKELPNYHLKTGDVIMGRRGEMARCALVGEKENGWLCGTGSLFFRPNLKKINPQYLYWVLSNSNTKAFLEGEAKGSTMSNLNLNIVRNIPFPLPSLEEQKKIVKQVEQLFAFADKIEARYTKAKTMLDKLPQSVLAKAFRGELVAQDPNDEPASVLLERIKAEKEKLAAEKKGKKTKVYSNEEAPVKIAAEKRVKYKSKKND